MYGKFEKLVKEKETTIYRVSKDTGIPPTTLYEWGYGRCTPKVDKLLILAKYFGVPLEYFLED